MKSADSQIRGIITFQRHRIRTLAHAFSTTLPQTMSRHSHSVQPKKLRLDYQASIYLVHCTGRSDKFASLTSSLNIPGSEARSTPSSRLDPLANTARDTAAGTAARVPVAGAPWEGNPIPREVDGGAAFSSGFIAGNSRTSLMLFYQSLSWSRVMSMGITGVR